MVVRSIKSGVFFIVEPCLEYYFEWEVTVDVCLHASKAIKCASVSGKPIYYVKKCLIYVSWFPRRVFLDAGKCEKSNYRGFQSDISVVGRRELWSPVSVNHKPWVNSIYPQPNLHIFLGEQSPSWDDINYVSGTKLGNLPLPDFLWQAAAVASFCPGCLAAHPQFQYHGFLHQCSLFAETWRDLRKNLQSALRYATHKVGIISHYLSFLNVSFHVQPVLDLLCCLSWLHHWTFGLNSF